MERKAQIGDVVKGPGYNGSILIGPVMSISPNSDSCNMSIGRPMQIFDDGQRRVVLASSETVTCVTCKEFVKLFALLFALALAFASSAAAEDGHGFAPAVSGSTFVGPPPDSVNQGIGALPACANCPAAARPAREFVGTSGPVRSCRSPSGKGSACGGPTSRESGASRGQGCQSRREVLFRRARRCH